MISENENINQMIADEDEERMKKNSKKENYDGEEVDPEEIERMEKKVK